ncbi:hypothetical protein BCR32DRAFT_271564 [Anaeromyces robustus]|uniref:Uncharacterized protein n=1 Tax=Anaeromyces robustus TaxID=1754192 RepID=A0A1Y1WRV0_9FUNG|nr:hypothetical protein BCR32DRAFT_271564 [Anaeromyces robustus]|eukprot:ORX75986.1 hypothetical protein BCR32DRAFT_271564 [Anaeromyces robustus]
MSRETVSRARKKYLFTEDENVLYDDEEQEEIINTLTEKNDKNNEIYSIAISIASVVLNLIFNYEIIANSVSYLSGFIIFISWVIICCITTSFRQYTTHKYYVRVDDNDDNAYNNGKNESDGDIVNSKYSPKNSLFKRKYLEHFQLLNSSSNYKRFDMSNDHEVPISPFVDIINYVSFGLSILIVILTICFQNWWHINKLIPFIPMIMTIANIYASYIIDQTTTEINSLKTFEAPFKGA